MRILRQARSGSQLPFILALLPFVIGHLQPIIALSADIPSARTLVFMAKPKNGTTNTLTGNIRNWMESVYEPYWKEISYYTAASNGLPVRGMYVDTRTFGYVDLPWPLYPQGARADSFVSASDPSVYSPSNRPVNFGGEQNYELRPNGMPGQRHGGQGPLIDGYWTPGERFYDANSNGVWDAAIYAEHYWSACLGPVVTNRDGQVLFLHLNQTNNPATWSATRGEIFADYDGSYVPGGVGYTPRVTIFVAHSDPGNGYFGPSASNDVVQINELDLTPESCPDSNEGDLVHTAVYDVNDPDIPLDLVVPTNGVFNYTIRGSDMMPMIFVATNNITGQPAFITYKSWRTSLLATGAYDYVYSGTNPLAEAQLATIRVPLYQAGELLGSRCDILPEAWIDEDGQFDPGRPEEPFQDFISWWRPTGGADHKGAWVTGIVGCPTGSKYMGNQTDPYTTITWNEYTNYICNNYPGDCAALIARAGNGIYDGPDDWLDRIDNRMIVRGYRDDVMTPPPGSYGSSGWDYYGVYGDWQAWWAHYFGTNAPSWDARVPNIEPFITKTNIGGWTPPLDSTWGYDGPREFADLPSSMHHTAGDGRLGEITSPYTNLFYGQDLGADNPSYYGQQADGLIPAAGPLAYNVHGNFGLDAGNVLNMEYLTWRTDGTSLTGPCRGHSGSGSAMIHYARDHRDVNLNGLIDQGETIPAESCSYFVDSDTSTPDGGRRCEYPYNWTRFAEDVIAINSTMFDIGPLGTVFINDDTNRPVQTTVYYAMLYDGAGVDEMSTIPGCGFSTFAPPYWGLIGGYLQVRPATNLEGLVHAQMHDLVGLPDMYQAGYSLGGFDLMAKGGLVHGTAQSKLPFVTPINLKNLLSPAGVRRTVKLYPVEQKPDQYFFFYGPNNEEYVLWYQNGASQFSGPGGRGVHIEHLFFGAPHLQVTMVQADGMSHLEDGVNLGDHADVWPGSTGAKQFTLDTIPSARWFDNSDSHLRIFDIRLPDSPDAPVEIDMMLDDASLTVDSDGDGLLDSWEILYFGNLTTANQYTDSDNDGVSDLAEQWLGTDPTKADTDGDGYSDFLEVAHGGNPVNSAAIPIIENFRIEQFGVENGNLVVKWHDLPLLFTDVTVQVELDRSTSLPPQWISVSTNLWKGTNATLLSLQEQNRTNKNAYYRLRMNIVR